MGLRLRFLRRSELLTVTERLIFRPSCRAELLKFFTGKLRNTSAHNFAQQRAALPLTLDLLTVALIPSGTRRGSATGRSFFLRLSLPLSFSVFPRRQRKLKFMLDKELRARCQTELSSALLKIADKDPDYTMLALRIAIRV